MKTLAAGLTILAFTLIGCIPTAQQTLKLPESLPPITYEFTFEPQPEENPLKAAIALLRPAFEARIDCNPSSDVFTAITEDYARNIGADFEETLIAKGYNLIGPFDTTEDMTFGEKEQAILALQPTITLTARCDDNGSTEFSKVTSQETGRSVRTPGLGRGSRILYSDVTILETTGSISITADINLVMTEPLSAEKVWQKDIDIPLDPKQYQYYARNDLFKYFAATGISSIIGDALSGQATTVTVEETTTIIQEADSRTRVMAEALEGAYQEQLSRFSAFFDPREIEIVIGEAERARELKRF